MTTDTLTRTTPIHDRRPRPACVGVDPELFFPLSTDTLAGQLQVAQALAVCRLCPVQADCLTKAMDRSPAELRNQVIGGRWFDHGGTPQFGPPVRRTHTPAAAVVTYRAETHPQRPHGRGECPECGRNVGLRADGTFRAHNDLAPRVGGWPWPCPGQRPTDDQNQETR